MKLNREYLEHERQISEMILSFARGIPEVEAICTRGIPSGYLNGKYVFLTCAFDDSRRNEFEMLEKRVKSFMDGLSLDSHVLPYGGLYSENFGRTIYRNNSKKHL